MPEIPATIPDWITDVGVVTLVIFFGIGLARRWWYTAGQVTDMKEQYERVAAIWEKVADERQETIRILTEGTEPIIQGNAAILRAVEDLQKEQERQRRDDWGRGRDGR